MNRSIEFLLFLKRKADWSQYGIIIDVEREWEGQPSFLFSYPSHYRIIIRPMNFSDPLKFNSIVTIFGESEFTVPRTLKGITILYKKLFDLHKVCIKVNNMKVFL